MPLISVIIPTYNRKSVLPRAAGSVLRQTFTDCELTVVDDGSDDSTPELDLWKQNPAIRYVRRERNAGVSAARNAGVRASSSPWIAFLDSDDEWLPEKLARQAAWLAANPKCEIMQCCETWVRNGKRVNPPKTHRKSGGDIFTASIARCMITPSTVVMRRSLFESVGGFDEALPACEDYDLWLRICCTRFVGLLDEELAVRYGGHANQLSSTVPRLDKYRIISLQKLIGSSLLTPKQAKQVREMLVIKAAQMAEGCRKSGNAAEQKEYEEIARRAREGL